MRTSGAMADWRLEMAYLGEQKKEHLLFTERAEQSGRRRRLCGRQPLSVRIAISWLSGVDGRQNPGVATCTTRRRVHVASACAAPRCAALHSCKLAAATDQ